MTTVFHDLYKIESKLTDTEERIIDSHEFQVLNNYSQSGINAYFSNTKYSRFHHTMGVFSLTSYFHPGDKLLRLSALCHDLGHIHFSHSLEYATKGKYSHKTALKDILLEMDKRKIFHKSNLKTEKIMDFILNDSETPVTHKKEFVNFDHLDAFINDAYYGDFLKIDPYQIIKESKYDSKNMTLNFTIYTAIAVQDAIIKDHERMFGATPLYREAIFSKLLSLSTPNLIRDIINKELDEKEILSTLLSPKNYKPEVRNETDDLIKKLERKEYNKINKIKINSENEIDDRLNIKINKVYDKRVLTGNSALDEIKPEYKTTLQKLKKYKGIFVFN